jgi:hypothetical protein
MSMRLLIMGLVLAGRLAAQAADLVIDSFDPSGRLTFHEIPAATAFRVEWTTNLASPAWSSNAPGIAAISASGVGTLTATVGVVHAWCYYRVAASVANVPLAEVTTTFDLTSEGWQSVSYPFRSHVPNPPTSSLPFDGAFGNPPGSVRVGDVYPETAIAAPAPYIGDRLSFYGGSLAYDIYLRYTDNVTYPAVVLNGGTNSLYYDAPSPPVNAWRRVTVPLSETGWKVSGTGATATATVFKAVLSNLVGLYIYTEWHSGADDTNVDNATMMPP